MVVAKLSITFFRPLTKPTLIAAVVCSVQSGKITKIWGVLTSVWLPNKVVAILAKLLYNSCDFSMVKDHSNYFDVNNVITTERNNG